MNKITINVPKGIEYFNEWKEFKFPQESCILNKRMPGCGFTEWVLGNDEDVILCSPRIILIQNKCAQHPEVFPVMSQVDRDLEIDKDLQLNKPDKEDLEEPEEIENREEIVKSLYERLDRYITQRKEIQGKPVKLIVTYDSFRILKDILEKKGILSGFKIYVDEFQSIFTDSRFKSDTELKFLDSLAGLVSYFVSATPMLDSYLDKLDEFKSLPYYELDWEAEEPSRVVKPNLIIRLASSGIVKAARYVLGTYLSGKFEKIYKNEPGGNVSEVESRELVVYVNSVNNIISIINSLKLKPNQVNILCANTPSNTKRIQKKLGKAFQIGTVPGKGEEHKMFTFCTRTVYLGADFYSTNARTLILSDAASDTLSVDISLDLPQILGRQRLSCNPWKNSAIFYYKPVSKEKQKMSKEEFEKMIKTKIEFTNHTLSLYDKGTDEEKKALADTCEDAIKTNHYKRNYISVNRHKGGSKLPTLVLNNLVMIAEQRAFDIQQVDYKDRFSVFDRIDKVFNLEDISVNEEVNSFFEEYDNLTTIEEKLKYICKTKVSDKAWKRIEDNLTDNIKNYLVIGKDRIKACGYNITNIKKELGIKVFNREELDKAIYNAFEVGKTYSNADTKVKLKEIYDQTGYEVKAKASDLANWFEIKDISVRINGKKVRSVKIIKKKN